ncbi:23S rRNA pseudouridine(2604) synthase RluF [Paenibacillus sp. N1-5-1-14]|uniref:23S rRNA pseudouridine(2604) synthase RluF n=1 Tax=Paenibacillus radicibacter TaxID=2972488 RepID=UPI0021595CA5|nr:23S rRNA pseudouridine(2604) synthase RluF [Paenibacillus radicibacter]MCR8642620.1 23S rRNA pseudouridine(2604) synthase RluF [Paenibacillus radicibacter]
MRINKYIAETGICSRREADRLIESRSVTINGEIAALGSVVEPGDVVKVSGKRIGERPDFVYIALNKPTGITSTTERHIRGNIIDFVNHSERIFPIGRLDKDSDGLILLTNDGDIVNELLRSENNHEKEYVVTLDRPYSPNFIKGMSSGVRVLGQMTKPCEVIPVDDYTFRIILTQGLNRQIRRMCSAFGFSVRKLRRVRIMNVKLGNLRVGQWRDLTKGELDDLFHSLNYKQPSN